MVDAVASVGVPDVELLMPSMKPMLAAIPRYNDIKLVADVKGTMVDIDINRLSLSLPGCLSLMAHGNVENAMEPDRLNGDVVLDGKINNVNFIKPTLLDAKISKQVNIPPTALSGNVRMRNGVIAGNLKAVTGGGDLLMDAMFNGKAQIYNLDVAMNRFPVNSIMPEMGFGGITARRRWPAKGLIRFSKKTAIRADINLGSLEYQGEVYSDIHAKAVLDSGYVSADVSSLNPNANMDLVLNGTIASDDYNLDFKGNIRNVDLQGLKMSETLSRGSFDIDGHGHVMPARNVYNADLKINDIKWAMPIWRLPPLRYP